MDEQKLVRVVDYDNGIIIAWLEPDYSELNFKKIATSIGQAYGCNAIEVYYPDNSNEIISLK